MTSELNKIEERQMYDKSIAKTFKGILRISPIYDLFDNDSNDNYPNDRYYDDLTHDVGYGKLGEVNAIKGMQGLLRRYTEQNTRISNEPLLHKKVPITDSVGNYLNWHVGTEGSTIGVNYDLESPVLICDNLTIGKQNKKIPTEKTIVNGVLNIENKTKTAKLKVGEVTYQHSKTNNSDYCSIIGDFEQPNSFVSDVTNLKDELQEKIENKLNNNFLEDYSKKIVTIPTGSVIWQYSSLNKWRNYDNTFENELPILQLRNSSKEPHSLQGVSKKTNYYINRDGKEDTSKIIPLHRRDYVLCDGSKYRIPICPLKNSILNEHLYRFLDLFHIIGYDYTYKNRMQKRITSFPNNITKERFINLLNALPEPNQTVFINYPSDEVMKITDSEIPFKFELPSEPTFENVDSNALYEEDMAVILSCIKLYEGLMSSEWTSIEDAKEWLKEQVIEDTYYFDSQIEQQKKDGFSYGKLITNFSEIITVYDVENKETKDIEIYNLPQVELFIQILLFFKDDEKKLLKSLYYFFNIDFQVPSFLSSDYTPVFISSYQKNNTDKIVQWKQREMTSDIFYASQNAHRHAIFKGYLSGWFTNSGVSSLNKFKNSTITSSTFVGGEGLYKDTLPRHWHEGWSENGAIHHYISDTYSYICNEKDTNLSSNKFGVKMAESGQEPDRGITSKPIYTQSAADLKYYKTKDANTTFHLSKTHGWFAPESITMLPLIKL